MSAMEDCLQLTQSLYKTLQDDLLDEEQRDEWLTGIHTLLDRREEILSSIRKPSTVDEQRMANEILSLNGLIQGALVKSRDDIQDKITRLQTSKSTVKKYIDPFSEVNRDGTFYDRKK